MSYGNMPVQMARLHKGFEKQDDKKKVFEAWYSRDPSFNEKDIPSCLADLHNRWRFVRKVQAADLDEVYHLSQGCIWATYKSVEEIRSIILRARVQHTSMSVGDLIKDPDGQWWIVAGIGFNKVELLKYKLTNEKFPRVACVQHNGEHPFSFKESVNGMVTACHEVMTVGEYEEIVEKEGLK